MHVSREPQTHRQSVITDDHLNSNWVIRKSEKLILIKFEEETSPSPSILEFFRRLVTDTLPHLKALIFFMKRDLQSAVLAALSKYCWK